MGRAECRQCGGDVVEVCPECEKSELASLRAKLAESEEQKARLRDAFTHEAEVLAAKLAEWEAAGRTLAGAVLALQRGAPSVQVRPGGVVCNGCGCATLDLWEDESGYVPHEKVSHNGKCPGATYTAALLAVKSDPLASRIVAEAGGKQ